MESKSRYHIKSLSQYNLSPVKVSLMTIPCTAAPWHLLEVRTPGSRPNNLPGSYPLSNATAHTATTPVTPASNFTFISVGFWVIWKLKIKVWLWQNLLFFLLEPLFLKCLLPLSLRFLLLTGVPNVFPSRKKSVFEDDPSKPDKGLRKAAKFFFDPFFLTVVSFLKSGRNLSLPPSSNGTKSRSSNLLNCLSEWMYLYLSDVLFFLVRTSLYSFS